MTNYVWAEMYYAMKSPAQYVPEVNWNVHVKRLNETHFDITSEGVAEGLDLYVFFKSR